MESAKHVGETGSVLVEAVWTLTTLFIFLLAIMEAGRLFQAQQFLTDAAREGARAAVAPLANTSSLADPNSIRNAVEQFLTGAGIWSGLKNPAVTVTCVKLVDGTPIAGGCSPCPAMTPCGSLVTVQGQYQIMTLAMFSDLQVTLKGKALMRNETSP